MKNITSIEEASKILSAVLSKYAYARLSRDSRNQLFEFQYDRSQDIRQTKDTVVNAFIDAAKEQGCVCGIVGAWYGNQRKIGDQGLLIIQFTLERKKSAIPKDHGYMKPGEHGPADPPRTLAHITKEAFREHISKMASDYTKDADEDGIDWQSTSVEGLAVNFAKYVLAMDGKLK